MKNNKITLIYKNVGKILIGCAAGITAFIFLGPVAIVPGFLVGILGSHLLEKAYLKTIS